MTLLGKSDHPTAMALAAQRLKAAIRREGMIEVVRSTARLVGHALASAL